ncbi:MAG: S8 family serine peptidase [Chloroflexia bacterium]
MRRTFSEILLVFLFLSLLFPAGLQAATASKIDPDLFQELARAPGGVDSFLVLLHEQADLRAAVTIEGHAARAAYVYQTLRATAKRSQARLSADLAAWGIPYRPFFLVNAIQVTGDLSLAYRLAEREEVARIVADPSFSGLDDPPPGPPGPPAVDGIEWNIARVHAPEVWALGYTGQGIVVGSVDTGVQYDHPALVNQYRGNLGGGNFDHNYNWHDAFGEYAVPTDPNGHGTHTTGTMVGSDDPAHPISATNAIGVAPGAQWIACKVSSSGGVWKASKYIECWEWMLAPTDLNGQNPRPDLAAHVVNNSWSCPGSEGCDPDTLLLAARALYAAGIAIVKSAGNSGSACQTLTNPSHYRELLAVGAFNSSDQIASFSSRGPAVYQGETYVKPDLAAPGVGVRSSIPGGGYTSYSGTSMASPHVAGLIALLWSACPELVGRLEATFQVVEESAEPRMDLQCPPNGPDGRPNNVWGWGIADALAAVQAGGQLGALSGTVTESGTGEALPGARLEVVRSDSRFSRSVLSDPTGFYSLTLPAATYELTATLYGYLPTTATGIVVVSHTVTPLDLILEPAPVYTLSGTVTDATTGAPLRATLSLEDAPVQASTDPATGRYSVSVAQGTYVLHAGSPGYVPESRPVVIQGNRVEDFALEPAASYFLRKSTAPCGPAFSWIDITAGGQPYYLGDDASTWVSIGGTFPFYGTVYNSFYIGSNGQIVFGSGAGAGWPGGNTIPSTFAPNNAVYAFWDDLNPANGSQGTIYTQLVDGHLLVIEFYQVQHYPSGNPETFEVILDLDSGAILLQYLTVSDARQTAVGIENADGTSGLLYAFHNPALLTDGLALAFYPVQGEHPAEQGLGILSGTVVVSGTGAPIAGASVRAEALTGGGIFTATTGGSGAYSLTLCADGYTVVASAAGYFPGAPAGTAVYSGSTTSLDLVLEPICEPVREAGFSWQPLTPTAGLPVTFTAYASGTLPITYTWNLGDGTLAQGQVITHTYATAGPYTVTLTATNCVTATATAAHVLAVLAPPCEPVREAGFSWQPLTPTAGLPVTFTAYASGTLPITYTWNLGDGTLAQGQVITHTYATAGPYTVTLTATNPCGTDGRVRRIVVLSPSPVRYRIYLPLVQKGYGP